MTTRYYPLPVEGASLDPTNPPGVGFSNGRRKLLFDAATDEIIYYTFPMPGDYVGSPVLKFKYSMASATTNEVVVSCEVMAVSDGDSQDMDSDSYDTINVSSATTVPGTAGHKDEISLTLSNDDSVDAGDYVALKIRRDADNAGDDATGDLEFWGAVLEYSDA